MKEIYMFMISYFAVFFLAFLVISFMQGQLFWKWLMVKTSRGKKVLIHCYDRTGVSYIVGKPLETILVFKSHKEKKELVIPINSIYKSIGVNNIDVDGINWTIFLREGKSVPGIDPGSMANIHERALMKFNLNPLNDTLIMVLLVVVIVILLFVTFKITGLPKLIETACSTITGGNI